MNKSTCIRELTGDKFWFKGPWLHREDGPACEYANGTKSWWLDGGRHREDGPAIERADGYKEWWLNGEQVDPMEHLALYINATNKT